MDDQIALACSVRHKRAQDHSVRSHGKDTVHLPDLGLGDSRVELVVEGEVWSATGARIESTTNPIVVEWWFSGGQSVSYALIVHAPVSIDGDRFIEVDSSVGGEKVYDFGAWKFASSY